MFWNRVKNEKEFIITQPSPPLIVFRDLKCRSCGRHIERTETVYDKDMCWDCLEDKIIEMSRQADTLEDTKILLHLLSLAERDFHD